MILMLKGRQDHFINSNQVLNTKVNGEEVSEMVLANRFGLMVQYMKELGRIIGHMAKVNLLI